MVARRAATDLHTVGLVLAPLAVRSRETRRRSWNELSHPDIPLLSNRKECDCRSSRRHHRDTAFADEVGVGVKAAPDGAGVTVGEPREHRDRDRTTVIKEREPRETDRTTVIKKENEDGSREKTVIHHDKD